MKDLLLFTLGSILIAILGITEMKLFFNTPIMVFGFIMLVVVFITFILTISLMGDEITNG